MGQLRTYGGWRPRRGFGLGRLSEAQTLAVFVAVLVPLVVWVITATAGLPLVIVLVVLVITLPLAGLAVIPHRRLGVSLGAAMVLRVRTGWARRRGHADWESGVFTRHPRRGELPGALAPTMPLSTRDGVGREYGLLWDRRTGRLTACIRVAPVGTVLADQERTDSWIGAWAQWKASLGYEPTVEWMSVTVESAPSQATELADYVADRLDTSAPAAAREMMTEVADAHRGSTADISVRVNLTFQPAHAHPAPTDDAGRVAEVSRALSGLEADLPLCGVALLGRATPAQMTHWLRAAYDPASRADLSKLVEQDELLAWADAGPVVAETADEFYHHDSGWSVSWALVALPKQNVTSNVLAPLLTPGRYHRRVTWTSQVYPADVAGDIVAREASGSAFRRELRRRRGLDESARERADEARARQAAEEEAAGAGVEVDGVYVTTTVEDPRQLPDAIADLESRARNAKLRLRRCTGWQSAGFAASLGVGVYPPELSRRGKWQR
ncbi:SCO6880 family protein [Sciscionella marina]|uniref:SCO6880 family protein n=1 Tax=Sciscionella marina TaxID=508770 RepID=UPI00037C9552|nr:SCO6880 family protein [Sciscionella marina]